MFVEPGLDVDGVERGQPADADVIVTGLVGTASEINGTGSEAIIAADAYALQNDLPARFGAGATWQSHIATANPVPPVGSWRLHCWRRWWR